MEDIRIDAVRLEHAAVVSAAACVDVFTAIAESYDAEISRAIAGSTSRTAPWMAWENSPLRHGLHEVSGTCVAKQNGFQTNSERWPEPVT